ncbi:site-specific integrase [Thermosulfurimonas sp. F29]|uniref:tyrosine-type recombinase/integrase n=1 Tax=Thermosulfurimonas sp. F29 TaxID=2867247 RepID=UPI001C829178|nr:site-specific integrase [Thermosulfurimonas sp. F29]MBX6423813.1 site-specific integrase [Thermosulfurimonas sp. F29]
MRDALDDLFSVVIVPVPGRGKKTVRVYPRPARCPKCKKPYKEDPRVGFRCPRCRSKPERLFVSLSWQGKLVRVYSDKQGNPLTDFRQAQRVLQLIAHELETGEFDPTRWVKKEAEKFLFKNLAQEYLEERKKAMTPAGFASKESWFRKWLIPTLGELDVRDLKAYHLNDLKKAMLDAGLSKSSVKKAFVELRAFLNWLKRLERIERLPYFPDRDIRPEEPPIRWLSPEQQALILSYIPPEHRNIIEFGFLTGLRIGELRALMWDAVDLREGYILVFRTFSNDRLLETPKEKAAKVIPLVGRIREIIQEQARQKRSMFVFSYRDPHYKERWTAYPYKRLLDIFKQAAKKAGINISLYAAIRHSFAMQRLKGGYSYEEVGAALGHKSPQTTRRYARLRAEMVESIFASPVKVVSIEEARKKRRKNGGKDG